MIFFHIYCHIFTLFSVVAHLYVKIFQKNLKNPVKTLYKKSRIVYIVIVESETVLSQTNQLIIFPLIIYYSGSSKRCLLLFEF